MPSGDTSPHPASSQGNGRARPRQHPIAVTGLLAFLAVLAGVLLPSPGAALALQRPPCIVISVGCETSIASAAPSSGPSDTAVTIVGTRLNRLTTVLFGGLKAAFHVNSDSSITAYAPSGAAGGSTLPVTGIADGQPVATTATFSYPIGEMDVTGPLPYPLSPEIQDSAWYNGGYALSYFNPDNLVFGVPSPVFHLTTAFSDASTGFPPSCGPFGCTSYVNGVNGSYQNIGNGGHYAAHLQTCAVLGASTSAGEPCTNWDNIQGHWVDVPNSAVSSTLMTPGSDRTTSGDLQLQASGLFSLQSQLADTLRIAGHVNQIDSFSGRAGDRESDTFSRPFNAIVIPSAFVQLSAVPYTIMYEPPGDASTVRFSTKPTYGANFSISNSNEQSNSSSQEHSSSTEFSLKEAFFLGFQDTITGSYDTTTTQGFGLTDDQSNASNDELAVSLGLNRGPDYGLLPGDGTTCLAPTMCSTSQRKHPSAFDLYMHEPFWDDMVVLLVHPQFAYYQLGKGQTRYVMTGSVPVTANITVRNLEACRLGETVDGGEDPCSIPYSDSNLTYQDGRGVGYAGQPRAIELTATDAANLVRLDPFYGQGQNAYLPASRALSIGGSHPYGSSNRDETQNSVDLSVDNTMGHTDTSGQTTTASTSVTTVLGTKTGAGGTADITQSGTDVSGAAASESLVFGEGDNNTGNSEVKTTYADSTAVSTAKQTTASVTLNDLDNRTVGPDGSPLCKICHDPLPDAPSASIFLDRRFGGFMFQDPSAPGLPRRFVPRQYGAAIAAAIAAELINQARTSPGFSDVGRDSPAKVAIGVLTTTGLMNSYRGNRFHPNAALTAAQLARTFGKALKLSRSAALRLLGTADRKPNGAVTERELTSVIARALRVSTRTAMRFVTGANPGRRFSARALVTRARAAEALFAALQARCLEGCRFHLKATTRLRPFPSGRR